MKKITQTYIMLLFLTLTICSTARANTEECIGMDPLGKTVHVIIDWSTYTLNVNGDVLKLVALTNDTHGFSSNSFVTTEGVLVYDSIGVVSNGVVLTQFNAATQELLSYAYLACHNA